jgi:hypothetical protein
MTSNMDFTDKARDTLTAAVQLAKDYANAQGECCTSRSILESRDL